MANSRKEPPVDPRISEYVGAAARALHLIIPVESRDNVERNFDRIALFARLVEAHPLDLTDESATIFRPAGRP